MTDISTDAATDVPDVPHEAGPGLPVRPSPGLVGKLAIVAGNNSGLGFGLANLLGMCP